MVGDALLPRQRAQVGAVDSGLCDQLGLVLADRPGGDGAPKWLLDIAAASAGWSYVFSEPARLDARPPLLAELP